MSSEETAAPLAAGTERSRCPLDAEQRMQELSQLLAETVTASLAGPLVAPGGGDALSLLDVETRTRAHQLLAPFTNSSCQLLAVVLPQHSRFLGFRYEAEDAFGSGDCLPGQDCPVGEAVWPATPQIESTPTVTVAYSLFRNTSETRPRLATLTVYFLPSRSWVPPP